MENSAGDMGNTTHSGDIISDNASIDTVLERLKGHIMFQVDPAEDTTMIYVSHRDIQILINSYEQLRNLSGIDGLTGLIQQEKAFPRFRNLYLRGYRRLLLHPEIKELTCACITFDADDFSYGNTMKGHSFMDNVIKTIGQIIREHIRETDLGIRLGGEEFGIFCETNNSFTALQKAVKIKDLVRVFSFPNGFHITLSGGISLFRIAQKDVLSLDEIFSTFDTMREKCSNAHARKRVSVFKEKKIREYIKPVFLHARRCSDDALYKSKALGKNRVSLYHSSEDYSVYRLQYLKKKKIQAAV
jgi:diguanylate cyclase (GGDEF)-like protein